MSLNNCINPYYLQAPNAGFHVNCGKCVLCSYTWRNVWSTRMEIESLDYSNNVSFLTCTYDNENYERVKGSVSKVDHQKFMKRLRMKLTRLGYGKIRFVVTSEYGKLSNTHRPHYHYIIYGLGYGSVEKKIVESCWTFGFIKLLPASGKFSYLMKYVLKGTRAQNQQHIPGKAPNFFTFSRRVGLGFNFIQKKSKFFLQQFKYNKPMSIVLSGFKRNLPKVLVKRVFGDDKEGLMSYWTFIMDKVFKEHDKKRIKDCLSVNEYLINYRLSLHQKVLNIYSRFKGYI